MSEEIIFHPGRMARIAWIDEEHEYSFRGEIARSDINSVYLRTVEGAEEVSPPRVRTEVSFFVMLDEGEAEYATVFEGVEEDFNSIKLWVVRFPQIRVTSIRHRRHHYRIRYTAPLYYVMFQDVKTIPIDYPHQGEIINLSSGGVRFFAPTLLNQADQMEVMFATPPYRLIVKASVVMSRALPEGGRFVSEAAMRFLALDGKQRDRLSRFIMQEQASRRLAGR